VLCEGKTAKSTTALKNHVTEFRKYVACLFVAVKTFIHSIHHLSNHSKCENQIEVTLNIVSIKSGASRKLVSGYVGYEQT